MSVEIAYNNIENIIKYGFLTLPYDHGGYRLVLKTITNQEYMNLRMSFPEGERSTRDTYYLALSTYMINGVNVLESRPESTFTLNKFYKSAPYAFIKELSTGIGKLNKEYTKSIKYLEGFCYSPRSRFLWKGLNGQHIASSNFYGSGIGLGLNSVQENWVIINQNLDNEEQYETQFNIAIMISSSMNSKGAKSLSTSFNNKKNDLKSIREEICRYGYDKKRVVEESKKSKWTAPVKTNADLVRELDRQMAGEKDLHDKFFDKWVAEQRSKSEEIRKAIERKQIEYRKSLEDVDDTIVEESRIATKEDIERMHSPKKFDRALLHANKVQEKLDFIKKIGSTVIKQEDRND